MSRWKSYLILVVEMVVVVSLGKSLIGVLRTRDKIKDLEARKAKLEEEGKILSHRLEKVQRKDYLEFVAREKLNLTKPGETLVIVSQKVGEKKMTENDKEEGLPNWKKWRRVILGF